MTKLQKYSEDALYNKLDALYEKGLEGSAEYKAIDTELEARNEKQQAQKVRQAELDVAKKAQRAALFKEYEEMVADKGAKNIMRAMVQEFGADYEDDYHIDDNYGVRSLVSDSSIWPCEDLEQAIIKRDELVYYRVYDRLFREGPEDEILSRLKERIIKNLS